MAHTSDFVVEISGGPDRYRVDVSSPAGEDSTSTELDADEILQSMPILQASVLGSAVRSRAAQTELERPAREVGKKLFDAVFRNSIPGLYLSSRQKAEEQDEVLRLVFRIRSPELAALPWELLHNPKMGGYLSLSQPLVRHVEVLEPVAPLRVAPPLHILGMVALPGSLGTLDAEKEKESLQAALTPLVEEGLVRLTWVQGQTKQDLTAALLSGCHVLHFVGHGKFDEQRREGMVIFADERGREDPLHAEALGALISLARPRPRLVVLNSCETGTGSSEDLFSSAAAVLEHTVPAVVAMQFAVTDHAAVLFSYAFYQALAANRSVDEAVRAGRVALRVYKDDSLECFTPILYQRSGDARLFDLRGSTPPEEPEETPKAKAEAATKVPAGERGTPGGEPEKTARQVREEASAAFWQAQHDRDWEAAVLQLTAAARRLPGDADVRNMLEHVRLQSDYAQGVRAEEAGDLDTAQEHYRAVLGTDPGHAEAHARLRRAEDRAEARRLQDLLRRQADAGDDEAAVRTADRIRALDPSWTDPDGSAARARERIARCGRERPSAGSWGVGAPRPAGTSWPAGGPRPSVGAPPRPGAPTAASAPAAGEGPCPLPTIGVDQWVLALDVHPGGGLLATGSRRWLRVWNAATGRKVWEKSSKGWSCSVGAVAFSPDGRHLAAGSTDNQARVWAMDADEPVFRFPHGHFVNAVAFSPDSRHLATGCADGTVQLWDTETGEPVARVKHRLAVKGLAFSPDGALLLSGSEDRTARVWDTAAWEPRLEIRHKHFVLGVAFSPDGRSLASCSEDRTAQVWDTEAWAQRFSVRHARGIRSVAFAPDGTLVATGGEDRAVRIWDCRDGAQRSQVLHPRAVNAVVFYPDGRHIASAGEGKEVRSTSLPG
ncbi:CHAT domain-containing protein [Streptomyces sp. HB2AG]|uniref:CHAT domain-containing protein n=1 Tax=Streptomyces sp. HB2AG TaxID=2983400 RepID=UPI0022AA0453|nr:CHAT domain-containing protein [Streptomyces sp. HB2AG]MCZ2526253.1 CHAT domain-containing protein [Streptomyces sp. HB2AG]